MKNVIHIFGASGSGTSTLGKYISDRLGYFFMDTDDYYWLPTDPPFTEKRDRTHRLALMKEDLASHENAVVSGSLTDWGDALIPLFTLAVRLVADTELRLDRIKMREAARFGSRIEEGGDMYKNHLAFLAWAAAYDTGSAAMRSRAEHDEWQKKLPCKLLTLDGGASPEGNYEAILNCIAMNRAPQQ